MKHTQYKIIFTISRMPMASVLFKSMLCSFFLLIIPIEKTISQQKSIQFKHISTDEGLSRSQVTCIQQDYKGFMWIGTLSGGLNKYDGTNFVVYRNIPSDTTSISHNSTMSIIEDHNKNLFFGTYSGLSIYNRNLDQFINLKFDKKSALYKFDKQIRKIAEDPKGNLWLATREGLLCFNYKNNTVKRYKHISNNDTTISDNIIESVFCDSKSRLWISTDKGLDFIDLKTGKLEHIMTCKSHRDTIKTLFHNIAVEDKEGNIWFGSNDGLFFFDNKQTSNTFELIHFNNEHANPQSLSHNYIKSLFVDSDSTLWIGTENGGINVLNKDKKSFSRVLIDDYNQNSLNNLSIHAIYQDRSSNMWFGTFGGGLNIALKNMDYVIHYSKLPGAPMSLNNNMINSFLENDNGQIWVATDGGGLNLLNMNTGRFVHYNSLNSNLKSDALLCFENDGKDNIWIGTWAGGLVNFNKKTNSFKSFTTKNSGISDDNIHSIAKDNYGNLWLGSQNGGLIKYNIKANKFKAFLPENSGISDRRVSVVKINSKGLIYCGATTAFQIYNPIENKFISYTNNPRDTNTISNKYVTDILIQNDTMVWLATGSGLNLFNPKTNKFRCFKKENGLPGNLIASLVIDKSNMLWVSTNNGLCRFDYKNNKFKIFTKSDGLQGNEFTDRSILSTKNGEILIGGTNGFNLIFPDKIIENKRIPNILITNFQIFYQPVKIGVEGSPLQRQISETDEISLNYNQSVLTFNFVSMDFNNPSKNQYAYMMEGFDADWVYCGNRREATYTNLSPGKYIFRVKGSNNDGVWNETGASITIIIRPPYWQTIWFKLIILAFLVSSIYIFIKKRIQTEKKVAKRLEIKVKQRTMELEKTAVLLKENQEEIELQKEELKAQRDSLEITNTILIEKQGLIVLQNEELDKHRNSLEKLVEERTQELEKALYSAEESNRLKSSFLANMSHEIRTPMNAIIGFSSLLTDEGMTTQERRSMVDIINKSCNSLLVLINDILDLSKIQADQMTMITDNIDLIELFIDIQKTFLLEAKAKGISIILNNNQLPEKLIVHADFVRVKQVLTNLITNALKFTNEGIIEFGIKDTGSKITIYVRDSGIGIPSHFGNTIFDRFTKIEDNKNILYGGTGLGLSISKSLVELWNGEIWYESEVNVGSTFYFTIPNNGFLEEMPKFGERGLRASRYPDLHSKTILIVEDQEINYIVLNKYLKKTQAHIIWAHNGQEAISIFNSYAIDLILMDIKMPIMDGIEATIEIRKTNPTVTIIAQTAYAFDNEIRSFLDFGMNGYITKPIRENELLQLINEKFGI
jgi:signal transduction histidine kinase/ligand-binding sensor domain-containing protein